MLGVSHRHPDLLELMWDRSAVYSIDKPKTEGIVQHLASGHRPNPWDMPAESRIFREYAQASGASCSVKCRVPRFNFYHCVSKQFVEKKDIA
uniref:Uncharacterized protein n=1 Tax=Pyxicephalus adspersus TaxID=30357 RepID=A0AAV3B832_PYXAD|nr:TPA: hypothetical protein GDO54_002030 [Pyxicephalus adspersus]